MCVLKACVDPILFLFLFLQESNYLALNITFSTDNMGVFFNHFYSQLFVRPAIPTKSFAGQTVIITGSNVGLGKEAARHIVALGASKLILAVRNIKAGEEAKKDIENTTQCGKSVIEVWQLDLASYGEYFHSSCPLRWSAINRQRVPQD